MVVLWSCMCDGRGRDEAAVGGGCHCHLRSLIVNNIISRKKNNERKKKHTWSSRHICVSSPCPQAPALTKSPSFPSHLLLVLVVFSPVPSRLSTLSVVFVIVAAAFRGGSV